MVEGKKNYHVNEKVLVYQGPVLYDAKITKTFDPVTQKVEYYEEKKKENIKVGPDKKFPNKYLSQECYMVHYQGWNSKWDEWVDSSRILELTNENMLLKQNIELEIQEQERLKREELEKTEREKALLKRKGKGGPDKTKGKIPLKGRPKNGSTSLLDTIINGEGKIFKGRGKKAQNGPANAMVAIKEEDTVAGGRALDGIRANSKLKPKSKSKDVSLELDGRAAQNVAKTAPSHYESRTGFTHHEMKTFVPDELKIVLIDDLENITKNNKQVVINSNLTVSKTLADFTDYLTEEFSDSVSELNVLLEITESIKQYFEQSVGTFLLYRYERPQYNELLEKEETKSLYDIYGPIFLLRLISIFPNILVLNNVDANTIRISKAYLDIILHWLTLNKEKYFTVEYENQSPWVSIMHG